MSRAAAVLLLAATGCSAGAGDRVFRAGDCFSVSMKYRAQGEERENDRLCTLLKDGEGKIFMHPVDEVRVGGLSAAGIQSAIRDKAAAVGGIDVLDVRVEFHGRIELPEDPRGLLKAMVLSEQSAGPDPVFTYPPITIPGETPTWDRPHRNPVYRAQLAVEKMFDLGVEAFPVLVEHLGDRRQSVAVLSIVPCTLGAACYGILASQMHVRLPKSASSDYEFLDDLADLPAWWRERQGSSLRDLQVEAAVYTLVMAEAAKDASVAATARDHLRTLGATWEPVHADLERLRKRHVQAVQELSVRELIGLLAPAGRSYVERRFGRVRAGDAWGVLAREKQAAALPLLVEHADDAKVGDACLEIMRQIVEDELHYAFFDFPELSAIRRETVRAWWERRSTLTLRELRLDAARHWLRRVDEAPFADEDTRRAARERVQTVLRTWETQK